MCELLGACFAEPVSCALSINAFARRDIENIDGWGLAWYPDRSLSVAKEPITWRGSEYATFLGSYKELRSHIYLAHVRAKTRGETAHQNTHPFSRELNARHYGFAHNGTIPDARSRLPVSRFHPIGTTDSEHLFCFLLDRIADRRGDLDETDEWEWLHQTLRELNEAGKLNCLLSDGRRLFCYHDANGFKGLCYSTAPVDDRHHEHLEDRDLDMDFHADSEPVDGTVVATKPLNEEHEWRRFNPGELIVLERGAPIFTTEDAHARA